MASKPTKQKKQAVSPVNGQPLPRGRQFTSETAREARQKRTEKENTQKSITQAFLTYMGEIVAKDKDGTELTGAQAIAKSIIRGASKGSAEMVKIALSITGESPSAKVQINNGNLADLIDGLKEPITHDLYTQTTGIDGTMEN